MDPSSILQPLTSCRVTTLSLPTGIIQFWTICDSGVTWSYNLLLQKVGSNSCRTKPYNRDSTVLPKAEEILWQTRDIAVSPLSHSESPPKQKS